jgi:serine/threonine protein kinase
MPYPQVLSVLDQVLSGLAYAHEKHIIHRDIKPANIYLLPDGAVKILDFGLSCPPGDEDLDMSGTIQYMAPEQIEGDPVDHRTDLYGLGMTAFEMVTGQRPYPDEDLNALVEMHLEQDIPDPAELAPDIPSQLRDFIIRACRRDPEERFQSLRQARNSLEPLAREMGLGFGARAPRTKCITNVILSYDDDKQVALNKLLERFSAEAAELGAVVKAADYKDL